MDKKIKNIVFDFGGVLVDLDFERCMETFRKAGFRNLTPQKVMEKEDIFQRFERGEVSAEVFRDALRKETSDQLTDSQIDEMWRTWLIAIPRQKLDLLLELRGKYMVYLLSNTNQIHWDYACELFRYHGFTVKDYFEETFLSFQMHLTKPDPAIYQEMLRQAGIAAEETFFIDDLEANCEAAAKLGIQTYHYHIGEDLSELFD